MEKCLDKNQVLTRQQFSVTLGPTVEWAKMHSTWRATGLERVLSQAELEAQHVPVVQYTVG